MIRIPLPPDVLVSALQDRIHKASGPLISATAVRISMSKDPAETQPLATSAIQHTPTQWAAMLLPPTPTGRIHDDRWKHEAASALHGWALYQVRTGQPVLLDQTTYLAALEAASGNTFAPHPAADCSRRKA